MTTASFAEIWAMMSQMKSSLEFSASIPHSLKPELFEIEDRIKQKVLVLYPLKTQLTLLEP